MRRPNAADVDRDTARPRAGMSLREWLGLSIALLVLILSSAHVALAAGGSKVIESLMGASDTMSGLTGKVSDGGAFSKVGNSSSIPFLGGGPGSLVDDLFADLSAFDAFDTLDTDETKDLSEVKSAVDSANDALGGNALTATYFCGSPECADNAKVGDLTSIVLHLSYDSPVLGQPIPFSTLNLPSLGFSPLSGSLKADLNWSVHVDVVADGGGIHLAPASGHALNLHAEIALTTDNFKVNLGALVVKATQQIAPKFEGDVFVDLGSDGSPSFGFGPNTKFEAKWHLATSDESPLTGVEGDLHILWKLPTSVGTAVDASALTITMEHVSIDTEKFVGDGIQQAAAGISEVTHPLRTALSPLLEPIPGLSDLSSALGGDDVTMLRFMEEAKSVSAGDFPTQKFSDTLEQLKKLDDVVGNLQGGGPLLDLGTFTLTGGEGGDALRPIGEKLAEQGAQTLKKIAEECSDACKKAIGDLYQAVNGAPVPGTSGFKFDIPVMDNPASLAGMLLGRDVDLITFDTGPLGYQGHINLPLARFFVFAVSIDGDLDTTVDIKGGVDTRGIADAIRDKAGDKLLHGVYLQNPDSHPVIRVFSDLKLDFSADVAGVGVHVGGGPKPNINMTVPGQKDTKLRPAVVQAEHGIGCELLKGDGSSADFSVFVTASFDYYLDKVERTLAEHTFLTRKDICDEDADATPVAYPDGNGNVIINPAGLRNIKSGLPDTITVWMVHEPANDDPNTLVPKTIVVTGNNGVRAEISAVGIDNVRYETFDFRPVNFRVIKNDDIPFEKKVFVSTGDADDDVLIESSSFGSADVHGGADKLILHTGGSEVDAGPGDDYVEGSTANDIISGGDNNDTIDGGGGADLLRGGLDNDVITESGGNNACLIGDKGDDLLVDGTGADKLIGDETNNCDPSNFSRTDDGPITDGNDTIITGGGADFVVAGNGNDKVRLHGKGAFDCAEIVKVVGDECQGHEPAWRVGVVVYGNGGNDTIDTGDGEDIIHGGSGNDTIVADGDPDSRKVTNGAADKVWGGTGADTIDAMGGADTVFGDNGKETCDGALLGQPAETDNLGGDDTVNGGDGDDVIALEVGDDHAYGNNFNDTICGGAGSDTIYGDDKPSDGGVFVPGGSGEDTIFGGSGIDFLYGGPRDDLVYGNDGGDYLNGGDANDRLVGGSSAASLKDGIDVIHGDDGDDVIVGDNGTISNAAPRVVHVFDLFAADATLGGGDFLYGDLDDDRAFGGIGNDAIFGGAGDDMLEGNSGDDAIHGDANDDDIIGGTSDEALPGATAGQTAADAPDGGESILSGGSGRDVIIGDNGNITRPGGTDPIVGGPARTVALFDRDRTGAALNAVSGGDYIVGDADRDRLYGQGGDDYVKGNDGDDYAEGSQGGDRLEGNAGEDDLIGGSSFTVSAGIGDPDGGDQIAGGAGGDVIVGDNAVITRATTGSGSGFDWDSVANNWLGQTARRSITLLDKATLTSGKYGDDLLSGGADSDVLFGQDGVDRVYGGTGDDSMEGNGGGDVLYGDQNAAPTGKAHESGQPDLDGAPGSNGQDDQIGGSSWVKSKAANGAVTGQRDGNDEIHGDGNADVQLGDNGRILRVIVNGQYATYQAQTGKPTIVRQASPTGTNATALPARFDVGTAASAGVWGDDTLYGDAGDDLQLAGDGNDTLYGGDADDDMYGELGDDRMFGEGGEDAMVGDRGVITNRLVGTPGAPITIGNPTSLSFTPYAAHPLDRRVDLNDDGDGAPLQAPGISTGGNDYLRGGTGHDALHGAAGNDLMNGDTGGDYLFGDDGADVMWGGKGRECADPADLACNGDRGTNDANVDYLFGGNGVKTDPVTGGADILDFRPRPGIDPATWFEATNTRASDALADHQHHQGIDWIYGGWDRDVMQADIADNGPNPGDRLIDWTGAYNLYDHCPAAYGGYNDIRLFSPNLQTFLQQLANALGAGKSLADVQTKGTSGYNELALVFNADVKANSGSAYPGTPGHFDDFSCAP